MNQPKTYRSQIFRNFKAMNPAEFRKVVHFYERHEKDVLSLDFEEYFEMLVSYTNALFEIAEYRKHLLMADAVVETSIIENVSYINGEEIFRSTLFRKAASFYNLFDYKKAIYVLQELLKMEPTDASSRHFLERCLRADRPQLARHARAAAIALFLSAALTVFVDVVLTRHFLPEMSPFLGKIWLSMFSAGLFVLIGGKMLQRLRARRQVQRFVNEAKAHKFKN